MHLVLEVYDPDGTMTSEARADAIDRSERILRTRIDQFGVEEPSVQTVGGDRIIVELPGIGLDDESRAKDLIQQSAFLEFKLVLPVTELQSALSRIDRQIVAALGVDSLRALGRDEEGPSQDIQNLIFGGQSADSTQADSTGVEEEPEEEDRSVNLSPFTSLLLSGDVEGAYLVATEDVEVAELFFAIPQVQRALPRNISLHWEVDPIGLGQRTYHRLYVTEEDAFVTGEMLQGATAQRDPQFNQPQVAFEFDRAGGRRFSNFTTQHIGDYIAIVLDDEIVSAPVVQDRIGASGVINLGNTDMVEAADLALVLRAGALPARLEIMEERTVGPSLGQDSIDRGQDRGPHRDGPRDPDHGALLPRGGDLGRNGAGCVPDVGLGWPCGVPRYADAPWDGGPDSVCRYGRGRKRAHLRTDPEELSLGRATRTAVDEGFAHALSAIVDANITTLITALILFQFGSGPVKGFAVTLSIGIVASFFSALYVTRTFFLIYLSGKKASDPISI